MALSIVILAAGQSTRMQSQKPKLLHLLAGKPIIEHVIQTAQSLKPNRIYMVYGPATEVVYRQLSDHMVSWVEQKQPLGTGHALMQAMLFADEKDRILLLYGDNPLISAKTIQKLLKECPVDEIGLVTMSVPNPSGLGRILRNKKKEMIGIVEEKDANATQKKITEINSGILVAPAKLLNRWLPKLKNDNKQEEYYVTDIFAMAVAEDIPITTVSAEDPEEVQGVNDRVQLNKLERFYQKRLALQFMQNGVTISDPERFDARGEVKIAKDVLIDVGVVFEGKVSIGSNSYIGPYSVLRDVTVGENVVIKSHSVIEDSIIANRCTVGPFARIRPGTYLEEGVNIGNFVEVKRSHIGPHSKINHLSYVGDATVGKNVNVGAGTITCNYDGVKKHPTTIGDNAFIGSNTALIAPLKIGINATIGAGSTIKKDAPAEALTISRAEQRTIPNWRRSEKEE